MSATVVGEPIVGCYSKHNVAYRDERYGVQNGCRPCQRFVDVLEEILTADTVESFRFNTSPDETHVGGTAGMGFTFNNQFQLDVAFTDVNSSRNFILSIVRRWKQ